MARLALEGLEERCLLAVSIREFLIPTPGAFPSSITAGPDGNLWFMDSSDQIGRITPAGVTVEFPIPNFPGADSSWYGGMTTGPDGNLWFAISSLNPAYPGRIGRITPAGDVTEFATHSEPNQITVGPDGNLWFTADFAIGRGRGRSQPAGAAQPRLGNGRF